MAQTIYILGTVVGAILSLLTLWHTVDAATAANITDLIDSALKFLGVAGTTGASATAAIRVSKQRSGGLFDTLDPGEQIAQGAQQLREQQDTLQAQAAKAQAAISDALGNVPVVGPLAQELINAAAGRP